MFGYTATVLAALVLAVALAARRIPAWTVGMLYGSALVAFLLGLALLPMSILGIVFFGLGLLGFAPFVAAMTYRNAGAEHHFAQTQTRWSVAAGTGALVFVLIAVGAQVAVNVAVGRAMRALPAPAAVGTLRAMTPLYDMDQLVWTYRRAESAEQKERLARAFHAVTGGSIEERLTLLLD
jgi:energy-coupling factor transporter transmembrane protein EcfT